MRIGEFSASKNMLDIAEESVIWKGNTFCVSLLTTEIQIKECILEVLFE